MALPPIQSTQIPGNPPAGTVGGAHEYHVWIEVEEVDENGDHFLDHDCSKLGTYSQLHHATGRANFVEWLVTNSAYVVSPDGLHYWMARARL